MVGPANLTSSYEVVHLPVRAQIDRTALDPVRLQGARHAGSEISGRGLSIWNTAIKSVTWDKFRLYAAEQRLRQRRCCTACERNHHDNYGTSFS